MHGPSTSGRNHSNGGDEEQFLPVSAALREELFSLHRDASFISSTGSNIKQALADDWPTNPNTALPAGAGRLPVCPKEEDSGAGESYFGIHRVYMSRSRCKTYPDTS